MKISCILADFEVATHEAFLSYSTLYIKFTLEEKKSDCVACNYQILVSYLHCNSIILCYLCLQYHTPQVSIASKVLQR